MILLIRREASSYLNSWRGFPLVNDMEVDRDVRCEMLLKHFLVLFSELACPISRSVRLFYEYWKLQAPLQ